MTDKEQKKAAEKFSKYWEGKGSEKAESQPFWLSLLRDVFGVNDVYKYIQFESKVKLDNTSFIDGYIDETHVLIEQKSIGKNLKQPIKQSGGSFLTPFQQAKRYSADLPYSERPRWIVTCNFEEFNIYDMEQPNKDAEVIFLKDLPKEYHRLNFLVDSKCEHIKKEEQVSLQAGEIVGKLYDELLKEYKNPNEEAMKSLNILCVRLVFCLYAEDSGVFGKRDIFHDYLSQFQSKDLRRAIKDLFEVLNTEENDRDKYLSTDLQAFPYVNGGLFADDNIEIPNFNDKIKDLLLKNASEDFDWSEISPTIFGAVFESTLNPETRHSGGMHYTSIQNIHKVIDPLFLDDLKVEFEEIKSIKVVKDRKKKLDIFQDKLGSLTFFDPACGSGNFLTETYLSLRKIENELISLRHNLILDTDSVIKVKINQFYGTEINDFAVTVAKTALWIAEAQMMSQTESFLGRDLSFLPLKSYANITEANALQIDWESVVNKDSLNYIMGNPPFLGSNIMGKGQKADVIAIFGKIKNVGKLDYVTAWYKKAVDLMLGTKIRTAFVSTNSITQGEQVAILWKSIFKYDVEIFFAHQSFKWSSEAKGSAAVHCVIIGLACNYKGEKYLYSSNNKKANVSNINAYLVEADNILIETRQKPLYDVPEIGIGNRPVDNGNYLFTREEKEIFIQKEPQSEKYFKPWYGAYEFINRKPRYCLWLGDCQPNELRKMPECMKRVNAVREFRLLSTNKITVRKADTPIRFDVENIPTGDFIIMPETSSENRRYIPMGFMSKDVLCSNLVRLMPYGTLYHFGVLTSNVHMAWVRAICGRLKSDYRYSKDIVYNNFPWCEPTDKQKEKIEKTAQAILDARELYPDNTLADLYDEVVMPAELRKAHRDNDKAVMEAYGFDVKETTETLCVAHLMQLYIIKVDSLEKANTKVKKKKKQK